MTVSLAAVVKELFAGATGGKRLISQSHPSKSSLGFGGVGNAYRPSQSANWLFDHLLPTRCCCLHAEENRLVPRDAVR